MIRLLRRGASVAFAVDGPRGPYGSVHPGAIAAARRAGASLVPVAACPSRALVLTRAWDRFELPLPFSKVVLVVGAPVELDGSIEDICERLSTTLRELRQTASGALCS
jgi:hypothetical protein